MVLLCTQKLWRTDPWVGVDKGLVSPSRQAVCPTKYVSIPSRADFSLVGLSRLASAQGCLRVRLARLCRQLSTVPCGHVCGQALRADGPSVMDRCGCTPLGISLPLSCSQALG